MIGFKRSVGGQIQRIGHGNGRDGASLLTAGKHNFYRAQIAGRAQDLTLAVLVASQDPKAVAPRVVNDIVDVANRTCRKRVGDMPRFAEIRGRVDGNLIAVAIVEILAPVNGAVGQAGKMQGTSATGNFVSDTEFLAAGRFGDDRAGHGGDQGGIAGLGWIGAAIAASAQFRNGKCMKAVAHEASGKRQARSEISPPGGMKVGNGLPLECSS